MTHRILFAAALLAVSTACTPTCENVCKKVRECDLSPRLAQDECEMQCNLQANLYDDWDDQDKQDRLTAHNRCLLSSTCDEVADGVCYDDELFAY